MYDRYACPSLEACQTKQRGFDGRSKPSSLQAPYAPYAYTSHNTLCTSSAHPRLSCHAVSFCHGGILPYAVLSTHGASTCAVPLDCTHHHKRTEHGEHSLMASVQQQVCISEALWERTYRQSLPHLYTMAQGHIRIGQWHMCTWHAWHVPGGLMLACPLAFRSRAPTRPRLLALHKQHISQTLPASALHACLA